MFFLFKKKMIIFFVVLLLSTISASAQDGFQKLAGCLASDEYNLYYGFKEGEAVYIYNYTVYLIDYLSEGEKTVYLLGIKNNSYLKPFYVETRNTLYFTKVDGYGQSLSRDTRVYFSGYRQYRVGNFTGRTLAFSDIKPDSFDERGKELKKLSFLSNRREIILPRGVGRFDLVFDPKANSDLYDPVWSIDDESIGRFVIKNNRYCEVLGLKEGSTIIRARIGEKEAIGYLIVKKSQ